MTREVGSLQLALAFRDVLLEIRRRATIASDDAFESCFKEAVRKSLVEHNLDAETLGLRFCIILSVLWLPRPLITPCFRAFGESMEAGLRAWHRLGEARGFVPQRGTVLGVLSPADIAKSWARVRAAYISVLPESGAAAAEARLDALEVMRSRRAEIQFEKWSRSRMAGEERRQRSLERAAGHVGPSAVGSRPSLSDRPCIQDIATTKIESLLVRWSELEARSVKRAAVKSQHAAQIKCKRFRPTFGLAAPSEPLHECHGRGLHCVSSCAILNAMGNEGIFEVGRTRRDNAEEVEVEMGTQERGRQH